MRLPNKFVTSADSLVTTKVTRRKGFLEFVHKRNRESIDFIDKAKAFKALLANKTDNPKDILKHIKEKDPLIEAAGVSSKAKAHLDDEDVEKILADFVKNVLEPAGVSYVDEATYRYLLTQGDALGGKMRNIVGKLARGKLTETIIGQFKIKGYEFYFATDKKKYIRGDEYRRDHSIDIKSLFWLLDKKEPRTLIYDQTSPIVEKNIDITVINKSVSNLGESKLKEYLSKAESYVKLGELKGGIDPAGADEHWKTGSTALKRIRERLGKRVEIFFVGAAIEKAMAAEIFNQYKEAALNNCANLHDDDQLNSLCEWLVE